MNNFRMAASPELECTATAAGIAHISHPEIDQ